MKALEHEIRIKFLGNGEGGKHIWFYDLANPLDQHGLSISISFCPIDAVAKVKAICTHFQKELMQNK